MNFRLELQMGNAAFEDNVKGELEIIFKKVVATLERQDKEGLIYDSNGNRVGKWVILEEQ